MPSFTLIGGQHFAEGTTVGAYPADAIPAGWERPPTAPALETKVITGGQATFTNLVDGGRYAFGASIGGLVWRYTFTQVDPNVAPVAEAGIDAIWRPATTNYDSAWQVLAGWVDPLFTLYSTGYVEVTLPHFQRKTAAGPLATGAGMLSYRLLHSIPDQFTPIDLPGNATAFFGFPTNPTRLIPVELYLAAYGTPPNSGELWADFDPGAEAVPQVNNVVTTFVSMRYPVTIPTLP